MTLEVTDGAIEFECFKKLDEDNRPATFESGNFRIYDDGAGYFDIKCLDECPYCDRQHWA